MYINVSSISDDFLTLTNCYCADIVDEEQKCEIFKNYIQFMKNFVSNYYVFAVSETAIYSVSIVDSEMSLCLIDFQ